MTYKFEFEKSPAKKGTCPECKQTSKFRHYINLPREFGICERTNNCGYHKDPHKESASIKKKLRGLIDLSIVEDIEIVKTTNISLDNLPLFMNKIGCNFQYFCLSLGISKEHLNKWLVTQKEGQTKFIYSDGKSIVNIKSLYYLLNGKRSKDKTPFYLKAAKGTKYDTCLYGLHLLDPTKKVCLVESEKTAVIASWFYTQYNWLATGGSNGLTDAKLNPIKTFEILYIGDNDKAGKENSTLKKLDLYKINYKKVEFKESKEGEDIADLLIRKIKPNIEDCIIIEKSIDKAIEYENNRNISEFERVENFISKRYEVRNNIVANKIQYREKSIEAAEFEELNENNIFRTLQKNFITFSMNKLRSLLGSEFVPQFNPIQNYFESLKPYDPATEGDIIEKLCGYIPVKEIDKERFIVQFKKMLVRSIACSLYGVVNKQAFILVHDEQNSGKTTFLRWLCPPALAEYIAENINTDKDSLIAMCTNFIINMDELSTLNRMEINSLKSLMSKNVFKGRLPYAARETSLIRRANIVGSTNNVEFLSDESGSVRWLCFEITGQLNFDYTKDIDINRVWAMAYYLLNQKFDYQLTKQEIKENEIVNSHHRIITAEQELIQAFCRPAKLNDHSNLFNAKIQYEESATFVNSSKLKMALEYKYPNTKINPINIGKAMRILGFQRVTAKIDEMSVKGYYIVLKNGLDRIDF